MKHTNMFFFFWWTMIKVIRTPPAAREIKRIPKDLKPLSTSTTTHGLQGMPTGSQRLPWRRQHKIGPYVRSTQRSTRPIPNADTHHTTTSQSPSPWLNPWSKSTKTVEGQKDEGGQVPPNQWRAPTEDGPRHSDSKRILGRRNTLDRGTMPPWS